MNVDETGVSIILPLYNKENSINRAINSVLNQSYPFFELVIVDDGSTDNSKDCAKAHKDNRIILTSQSNQGVSVARNNALKLAKFDLVAFIDGDDFWHTDYLKLLVQTYLSTKSSSVWLTRWSSYRQSENIDYKQYTFEKTNVQYVDYLSDSWRRSIVHMSAFAANKQAIKDVGGFPEGVKFYEDQDLYCRLSELGPFVIYNECLSYYVKDSENRACDNRLVQDMPPYFKKQESLMLEDHQKNSRSYNLKEYLVTRYLSDFSLAARTTGERSRAIKLLLVCRKTRKSKLRYIKCYFYLLIPPTVLTRLIQFSSSILDQIRIISR